MKIDTSKIPNFSDLPENVRDAITAMELPDMSQFVAKSTFDKRRQKRLSCPRSCAST